MSRLFTVQEKHGELRVIIVTGHHYLITTLAVGRTKAMMIYDDENPNVTPPTKMGFLLGP